MPPSEEEDPLDALDRVKEILADGDHPFPVDRRTLRDVMRNKMGQEVERIKFLSSGMYLKDSSDDGTDESQEHSTRCESI
jgi:hypothetical protein